MQEKGLWTEEEAEPSAHHFLYVPFGPSSPGMVGGSWLPQALSEAASKGLLGVPVHQAQVRQWTRHTFSLRSWTVQASRED